LLLDPHNLASEKAKVNPKKTIKMSDVVDSFGYTPIGHAQGKGRTEREPMTIPANTKQALEDWLAVRGSCDPKSPLFIALDRNTHGQRLAGNGIYHIVRSQLGAKAGVRARPHGLRHSGITSALDAFNGDYRKARAFSRHSSLDTVRRYDDNRADHAGQVASALDSILG
jgi:integrase/recombinase XerC